MTGILLAAVCADMNRNSGIFEKRQLGNVRGWSTIATQNHMYGITTDNAARKNWVSISNIWRMS